MKTSFVNVHRHRSRRHRRRRLLGRVLLGVAGLALAGGVAAVLILAGDRLGGWVGGGEQLSDAQYVSRGTDEFAADRLPAAVEALSKAVERNPDNVTARLLLGRAYLGMNKSAQAERELKRVRAAKTAYISYVVFLAQALLEQGKYAELLNDLRPVPELPEHILMELLALRVQAHLGLHDLSAAQEELKAAQEIAPQHPAVRLDLVRLRLAQGWPSEAATALKSLLEDLPGYPPAWSLGGDLALGQGDFKGAEAAYTKALELRYGNAGDFINRALARLQQGNDQGAEQDLTAARERIVGHSGILFAEALVLLHHQRYTEAWQKLEQTLEREPNYQPARYYLGLIHYGMGQWQQGIAQLTDYYRKTPASGQTALLLAVGALLQGEPDTAANTLQGILKQYPAEPKALELLSYIALAQGKVREGAEQLQRVAQLQPDGAGVHARLGLLRVALGEYGQAWQQLDQAMALAPDQEPLQALRVLSRVRGGQTAEALELSEGLRSRWPDRPMPAWLTGLAYRAQGDNAKAKAAFAQAFEKTPGYLPAVFQLTELALAEGQSQQARERLQQALEQQPGNPVLRLWLVELEAQAGATAAVRQQLEAALARQPDALPVRLRLAELWLADRQPKQAVTLLQQAPGLLVDNADLQEVLGRAQLAAGYVLDAVQTLRNLAWERPSAWHRFLLAMAYARQGDNQAAQRELDKALELEPGLRPAQVVQVRRLLSQGQLVEAGQRLATLRRALPNDSNVHILDGELALARQQPQLAVTLLAAARQRHPDSQPLALKLAQAYQQAGQADAALALYRDWLAAHPDDSVVQLALADTYLRVGRSGDAEATFTRLLTLRPNDPGALSKLGWILRERDPAQARRYAEKALEQVPDSLEYKGTLALILLEQGDKQRARTLLENSLSKWSGSPSARFYLVQALVHTGAKQSARWVLQQMLADTRPFPERPQAQALLKSLVN